VEILIHYLGEAGGSADQITAQTIGLNCGVTHCPGKIEYYCHYFIMSFRTQIHKKKFGKNGLHTLQGTMSHRPLTNASSLKITAAYCGALHIISGFSLQSDPERVKLLPFLTTL
jgi:hypothetical protein